MMHLVYPKSYHCSQFLLGITVVPREIQDNGYGKFWGVNKVHYGLRENGECHRTKVLMSYISKQLLMSPGNSF